MAAANHGRRVVWWISVGNVIKSGNSKIQAQTAGATIILPIFIIILTTHHQENYYSLQQYAKHMFRDCRDCRDHP
jgi:hypothetical protein